MYVLLYDGNIMAILAMYARVNALTSDDVHIHAYTHIASICNI